MDTRLGKHLSVFNHYAVEILESIGNAYPSQIEIDFVENILKKAVDSRINFDRLFPAQNPKQSIGKVLLIEDQICYAAAHTVLLNILNFEVDHVWHNLAAITQSFPFYNAVIMSEHSSKLNTLLIARYINQFEKAQKPKLIIITDRKKITEDSQELFLEHGVSAVLPRPISFNQLNQVL